MASVWIERENLKEYGIDPARIERVTGRKVSWAEVYNVWADDKPELAKFVHGPDGYKTIMGSIQIYFEV